MRKVMQMTLLAFPCCSCCCCCLTTGAATLPAVPVHAAVCLWPVNKLRGGDTGLLPAWHPNNAIPQLTSMAHMPGMSSALKGIMGPGSAGTLGSCRCSASVSAPPVVASHTARERAPASSSAITWWPGSAGWMLHGSKGTKNLGWGFTRQQTSHTLPSAAQGGSR